MQDTVYIVNELSDYLKADYKGKKYIFLAGKPVRIDYSQDPRIVTYLLSQVQLRLATANELEKVGLIPANPREETKNEKNSKSSPASKSN